MTTQRRPRGADHHLAKLDNGKVVTILIACRCLGKSAREAGRRFGIDERQVRRILAGTAWREAVQSFEQMAREVGGYAALGAAVRREMGRPRGREGAPQPVPPAPGAPPRNGSDG